MGYAVAGDVAPVVPLVYCRERACCGCLGQVMMTAVRVRQMSGTTAAAAAANRSRCSSSSNRARRIYPVHVLLLALPAAAAASCSGLFHQSLH